MSAIDDVLQRVARGEITPDEALALLGTPAAGDDQTDPGDAAGTGPPAAVRLDKEPGGSEATRADRGPLGGSEATRADRGPLGGSEATDPSRSEGRRRLPGLTRLDASGASENEEGRQPVSRPGDEAGGSSGASENEEGRQPVSRPGDEAGRAARTLKVRTLANALEIYADPSVAEVLVTSGSPSLRRDGDTLVVEPASASPAGPGVRFTFVSQLSRTLASLPGLDERVVLRVNPDLLVDIDASAVSLRIWGCEGGLRLRLGASSAKLDHVAGPLAIDVHSSSIKGSARVTGESHIHCESSSVKLSLLAGSDVRIDASNSLGKVVLPDHTSRTTGQRARAGSVIGRGTGRLAVSATMSSVFLGSDQ